MSDTHEEHSFTLDDLIQPHDTEMNESPVIRNPQSPAKSPAQSPHQPLNESPVRNPKCPAGSPTQSPPQPPLKRLKAITDEECGKSSLQDNRSNHKLYDKVGDKIVRRCIICYTLVIYPLDN